MRFLCKYGCCLAVCLMCLLSCSKVPNGILQENEMRLVLRDMLLAESMTWVGDEEFRSDTMKLALYESVFRKHGISRAMYDSSLMWYGRNLNIYMKVYERVLKDLRAESDALGDVQADATPVQNTDSVNVWPRREYLELSPRSVFNGVVFNLKPETSYSSGSVFALEFDAWGLKPGMKMLPEVRLCGMQDDTTVVMNGKVTKDGPFRLVLRTGATMRVHEVHGFIRLDNRDSLYRKVYLDRIRLIRYKYGKENLDEKKDSGSRGVVQGTETIKLD